MKTVSALVVKDFSLVNQARKLKFGDSFDCLDDLCDMAALEPKGLSSYRILVVLESGVKGTTFNSLKKSCRQRDFMDSCIVGGHQLTGAAEPQMIPSAYPSSSASAFMPQLPILHTREEAGRAKKNKSHISDNITTTSPVTSDLIDLFATNLLIPACNHGGTSILDLDCEYSSPLVSPDLKHTATTSSLTSARPGCDLLLIDSDDDPLDSRGSRGPNPSYSCLIEQPPSLNLVQLGALTTKVPPHLREAFEYPSFQKEVERVPTVVKVVISAPKEAKPERKDARSPILCPIISAKTALHSEVGHAAWPRWVTENAMKVSVSSPTPNPESQNLRSGNTRSGISTVHQNGRVAVNPKGPGQFLREQQPYRLQWHQQLEPGESGTQRAITLVPPEVTPVTWSDSGLPFEGLASRCAIDAPLGAVGYHNPKTVLYKRTSTFNCEEKSRKQLRGAHRIARPHPKVSLIKIMKEDVWTSQKADFICAACVPLAAHPIGPYSDS
ncbi:hypothetical protein L873DRAFT_1841552 [Choiromyces venosus 120613-1]|uniref:Uncharacterized protein n=1 Tax=Choiromyces venosus 120613-1 TaxID=1336337 RepID=A0A3N4JX51_9PEZI|nr:hypothetical protein L873DRAFT_1841552 [Choiromyces venosus 120613-1]